MNSSIAKTPFVAIACGGTGGHLFPGLAVAQQLQQRGCAVALLVSPKDIDQQAVKAVSGMEVFTLPAVGLQNRNYFSFASSFLKSFFAARKFFKSRRPAAVLAMGGFTSAPPVLAGKLSGAKTFLHESNTIPGKANRFLSRFVDAAFIGFSEAAARLKAHKVEVVGTPVRPQFGEGEALDEPVLAQSGTATTARADARPTQTAKCRSALGLNATLDTILVVGGSQGARGLNDLVLSALPLLAKKNWQWLHLTGAADFEKVKATYAALDIKVVVKPFLAEMPLALGAATACISRAGASSLAEIAAMRLPSALVPLPTAADKHQFFNAAAFEKSGAAKRLDQMNSDPQTVAAMLAELVENQAVRLPMQSALARWHAPKSAELIAATILSAIGLGVLHADEAVVAPPAGGEVKLKSVA